MEDKIEENEENNIDGQKLSIDTTSQNEEKAENIVSKPHLPPVPVNSFQFLNDWNEITPYLDLRYQYLKVSLTFSIVTIIIHNIVSDLIACTC